MQSPFPDGWVSILFALRCCICTLPGDWQKEELAQRGRAGVVLGLELMAVLGSVLLGWPQPSPTLHRMVAKIISKALSEPPRTPGMTKVLRLDFFI